MKGMSGYGKWVAGSKTKWITLLVWVALVGVLTMLWPSVNSQVANNASNLPEDSQSVRASVVAEREFPAGSGVPALLVWHRDGGIAEEDLVHITAVYSKLEQQPLMHQNFVPPLGKLPPQALQASLSEDRSTLVTPVLFDKTADSDQLGESLKSLKELVRTETGTDPSAAKPDSGDLSLRVSGPVGISVDATGLFKNADVSLLIATVILVLVFLLLIYRSPILALIPLVAVGFAYGVTSPVLGLMAREGWITVDSQAVSIMTVLLFGAGTDYCLFLISRFRQMLKVEENKGRALLSAISPLLRGDCDERLHRGAGPLRSAAGQIRRVPPVCSAVQRLHSDYGSSQSDPGSGLAGDLRADLLLPVRAAHPADGGGARPGQGQTGAAAAACPP